MGTDEHALVRASVWRRLAARAIDTVVFQVPLLVVAALVAVYFGAFLYVFSNEEGKDDLTTAAWVMSAVLLVLTWALPMVLPEWIFRASPGKAMLGMRVVRTDGERPRLWQAMVRNLPFFPVLAMPWVGLEVWVSLLMLQGTVLLLCAGTLALADGRAAHDLAGGTRVVLRVAPVTATPSAVAPAGWGAPGPAPAARRSRWYEDTGRLVGLAVVLSVAAFWVRACGVPGLEGDAVDLNSDAAVIDLDEGVDETSPEKTRFLDKVERVGRRLARASPDDTERVDTVCDELELASDASESLDPAVSDDLTDGLFDATFDCFFNPRSTGRKVVRLVQDERARIAEPS